MLCHVQKLQARQEAHKVQEAKRMEALQALREELAAAEAACKQQDGKVAATEAELQAVKACTTLLLPHRSPRTAGHGLQHAADACNLQELS